MRLVQALARCRPNAHEDATAASVLFAAEHWPSASRFRGQDRDPAWIDTLTTALNPALRAATASAPTPLAAHHRWHNTHRLRSGPPSRCWPGGPDTGSSGKTTDILPRRRPSCQQRPAPHRPGPLVPTGAPTSTANSLPGAQRHPAATQARNRPGDVPTPHQSMPHRRLQRPTPRRQARNITLTRSSRPLRCLAQHHLPTRTWTQTRRHPRSQLPPLAPQLKDALDS